METAIGCTQTEEETILFQLHSPSALTRDQEDRQGVHGPQRHDEHTLGADKENETLLIEPTIPSLDFLDRLAQTSSEFSPEESKVLSSINLLVEEVAKHWESMSANLQSRKVGARGKKLWNLFCVDGICGWLS